MPIKNEDISFVLLNLGICGLYFDDGAVYHENANTYLQRANKLDPSNADIWGYLTLIAMVKVKVIKPLEVFLSLKEAIKLKISNFPVLKKIAEQLLQ